MIDKFFGENKWLSNFYGGGFTVTNMEGIEKFYPPTNIGIKHINH